MSGCYCGGMNDHAGAAWSRLLGVTLSIPFSFALPEKN